MASYSGKFAPLDEEARQYRRKRARRSSSATSSLASPHPATDSKTQIPSKTDFISMGTDDKLNCLFDMFVNFGSMNRNIHSLTRHMYHAKAASEVNEDRLRLLEYRSIETDAKLFAGNLIFHGIPEVSGNEDPLAAVLDILRTHLKMNTDLFTIVKAYRIGKHRVTRTSQTPRHRAILISLLNPSHADEIMDNAKLLRGTNFGISRDYPMEIRLARQELWPEFKEARSLYGANRVQMRYPAALVINGDVVRDMFPRWHQILHGSRNSNVDERVQERYSRAVRESLGQNNADPTCPPPIMEMSTDEFGDSEESSESDTDARTTAKTTQRKPHKAGKSKQPGGYLLNVHPPLTQSLGVGVRPNPNPENDDPGDPPASTHSA